MRPSALFPMACAIVAFVLGMLCLFAGHKPGFMEDYHIVTLNTSSLGQNLIPNKTTPDAPTGTSIGSFISSFAQNLSNTIEGDLEGIANDVAGDIANKLASELGIHQFYSLHLMDLCEGQYEPNATSTGAKKNVTKCSNQTAMYHFDISQQISTELEAGKLHINISALDFPQQIQDGINALNVAVDVTFVLYAIGIAASGIAILTTLVAVFLHGSRLVSFGNWGLASISFVSFLIASVIVTVLQNKVTDLVAKYGNSIGLFAYRGVKYLILTWVACGVMFLASAAWVFEFCIGRKNKKREYTEKTGGGLTGGWRRERRSDEATLSRNSA